MEVAGRIGLQINDNKSENIKKTTVDSAFSFEEVKSFNYLRSNVIKTIMMKRLKYGKGKWKNVSV